MFVRGAVLAGLLCLPVGSAFGVGPLHAQDGCGTVLVEERATYACVLGSGEPTVVLAAGAGLTSRTWSELSAVLASSWRVVTFDRAGFGRSDPGPLPRTPARIARELHALLERLEIGGPLVLVGHSMGGLHVLSFARQYPEEIAGIVLLDTPPRGFEEARLGLLTESERQARAEALSSRLEGSPDAIRLEREGAQAPGEWDFAGMDRLLPLFVVTADSQDFGDVRSVEAHRELWVSGARRWLALSDDSHFLIAEGSGHMVHHDRQRLVEEVIRRAASSGPRHEEAMSPPGS